MMYLGKQWSQPDHIRSVGPCTWGLSSPSQSSSSQLVRSSYVMLFATQNKSATGQEGDRKLSADRIWAKCCGKIHMSCTQCCTKPRFPDVERVQKLLAIYISLFILLKWLSYWAICCLAFLLRSRKGPAFPISHPLPFRRTLSRSKRPKTLLE